MVAKPKGPGTLAEQMSAVPVRNEKVRVVEQSGGAHLTVPLTYHAMLRPLASAMKLRTEKTFQLDVLAYSVYRRIDGVATVETLADRLKDEFQLSFHEARVLVMRYLQLLMVRGLVVLAKPLPAPTTGG
ncbi:MAG: PqqD family protein [Planctomycetes bacterium]|nr:PqqD family protein [Planctomycetota bacterium]